MIKKEIKNRLGNGTKIITTINKHSPQEARVGGQMVICKENIANRVRKIRPDPTGLGLYLAIGLLVNEHWLWMVGIYLPTLPQPNS